MNRIIVFVASFLLFVVSSAEVIKAPPVSSQPYAKPALGPVEQFSSYSGQNLFDGDTLLKIWKAGENLKAPPERITTFEPVIRDGKYEPTGKKPPVAAVRSSPGEPFFDLDFGELAIGCYVVRVIAAVNSQSRRKIHPERQHRRSPENQRTQLRLQQY
ncbi:MAG: hypothetical protein O3B01_30395 [Planctomycetota bacterium]|nr:hypothetical protein [Planctomycetota bacterium]MDA1142893.1 hypothetical protein [Planctomycetota bacterium]